MGNNTQIGSANIKDNLNAKLLSILANNTTEYSRIFYLGQVMINDDGNNCNRIKVRIPLIDDIFYANSIPKVDGDKALPWCLPISSRFINTPENNSIVIVILSDPKIPFFGRIYLDSITDLSATDLFEKLNPEEKAISNWLNAENNFEISVAKPNDIGKNNAANKTKYQIGIRGRGNNKIVLDKDSTLITQNYKNKNTESYLQLKEDSILEVANNLQLVSKKGRNKKYHPVFDETLFDYLEKQNKLFQKIAILLNTIPAIAPIGGPCTASPNASQLIIELNSLKVQLKKLKEIGASKKIIIN